MGLTAIVLALEKLLPIIVHMFPKKAPKIDAAVKAIEEAGVNIAAFKRARYDLDYCATKNAEAAAKGEAQSNLVLEPDQVEALDRLLDVLAKAAGAAGDAVGL